jgi:23S rRNA maturation-related 3'-5' exoribonuclease YhaM
MTPREMTPIVTFAAARYARAINELELVDEMMRNIFRVEDAKIQQAIALLMESFEHWREGKDEHFRPLPSDQHRDPEP